MAKHRRSTRKNPSTTTWLLIGGGVVACGLAYTFFRAQKTLNCADSMQRMVLLGKAAQDACPGNGPSPECTAASEAFRKAQDDLIPCM